MRRGLACESVSSHTLPRLIGLGLAQELVLTGRIFLAKEVPSLFNYLEEDEASVLSRAMDLTREIALNTSRVSVALSKAMLMRNTNSPELAHLVESKAIYYMSQSVDANEGVESFLEKRQANFTMRAYEELPQYYPWWDELKLRSSM